MTHPSLWKEPMSPQEDAALWMGWVNHGELNLDTPTLRAGIAAFNRALREHAAARGHRLIDLDAAVPRDLLHFYDDCHLTARGNEVAARAIVDALLAGGGLP
jgi:glycine/D-amino acid oxidase-like deaminating enzyme